MRRPASLATIGYEGASLAAFIAALRHAGIRVLVDVRDVAYSRRPEFSSRALTEALQRAGLAYLHFRALGNPKPGRDAAKTGDAETYHRLFVEHLKKPSGQADLDRLATLAEEGGACIMCYERDPGHCHRSLVAAALGKRMPLTVRHLKVSGPVEGAERQDLLF